MATKLQTSKYAPNTFTPKKLTGDPLVDFGDYTMKIGKHKGKSLTQLIDMPKGKEYLYWFHDTVINKDNEKFYGKIMKVVEKLRQEDDSDEEDE